MPTQYRETKPEYLAAQAGLRYVTDDQAGWTRRRVGERFTYADTSGKRLSAKESQRVESLAIPPAWGDVWIAPVADAHLLATGRDDEDRKQYRYNEKFRAAADNLKFRRLAYFGRALRRLRPAVENDLDSENVGSRKFALASATRMLDSGLLRVGNDVYRRQSGAQGVTTVSNSTVTSIDPESGCVHLEFLGKGSVERDVTIDDNLLAEALDELMDMPNQALFVYMHRNGTASISSTELNTYVADIIGPAFSAKDFRTWGGTVVALESLAGGNKPAKALDNAAETLGNTRAVARSSYVAPGVMDWHDSGQLQEVWKRSRTTKWLTRAESATEKVLLSINESLSPSTGG